EEGGRWRILTSEGELQTDQVVVAMGPWSSRLLARVGIRVPLFVKRGYHMHYSTGEGDELDHWRMDAVRGFMMEPTRVGNRLTTGGELADIDEPPKYGQLAAAGMAARALFPALGARLDPCPWKGARPCLPDMKTV